MRLVSRHAPAGADARRPIPHEVLGPVLGLVHAVEVDAVEVEHRLVHGEHGVSRGLPDAGIAGGQPQAVAGRGAGPHALGPEARRQGPDAGLAHEVKKIDEGVGVRDPAVDIPVDLAVAQVHDAVGGGHAEPVFDEGGLVVAHGGHHVRAFVRAPDQHAVATFHVRERSAHAAPDILDRGDAMAFVERMRTEPVRVVVVGPLQDRCDLRCRCRRQILKRCVGLALVAKVSVAAHESLDRSSRSMPAGSLVPL